MPMAIPLLAAAGSVAAGITAGGVIGGMMIAGGVMSGVGALTGNKNLSKFGGLLSLAGGVGGLATGAFSATANTVAQAASTESAAVSGMDLAGDALSGGNSIAGAAESFNAAATPFADSVRGGNAAPGDNEFDGGAADYNDPTPAQGAPIKSPVQPVLGESAPEPAAAPDVTRPGPGNWAGETPSGMDMAADGGRNSVAQAVPNNGAPSWFDKATNWIKQNKEAANIGSKFVGGAMQAVSQQDALNTKMKLEEAARLRERARYNTSVQGALAGGAFATYQPPKG